MPAWSIQLTDYLTRPTDLATRVERLNEVRALIAELSPFNSEPVDFVRWVPAEAVHANDYNPNAVAPPEMDLLRLSIAADGYTQPIVGMPDETGYEVIDGFHRHRVGKEAPDIQERVHGYLPVVGIRTDRTDKGDRIASTIRHNRARGKHQVIAMSDIVMDLKRRNWSDDKIGRELGMDPDEVPYALEAKRLAPSWRRVCKSLLRNDYWGKGLGFSQHKSAAYSKYQDLMRRRREKWGVSDGSITATQMMLELEESTA